MEKIITGAIYNLGVIIEYIGVVIIVVAIFIALYSFISGRLKREKNRAELARNIIFGLEFIIAADILLVMVASSLNEILQLGGIVLIRVLLGYSLKKDIF